MQVLAVHFRIQPAHAEEFAQAIVSNAATSLARESGCRQFDVCRDPTDPASFFLYELYDDDAAVAVHLASAHFLAFDSSTRAWVVDKEVQRFVRMAA